MNIYKFSFVFLFFCLNTLYGCTTIKGISMVQASKLSEETIKNFDIKIPVINKAHALIVDVKINNSQKNYKFMIDTGALTVIDENVANEFTFNKGIEVELEHVKGSNYNVKMVTVDNIVVSGLKVNSCAAVILDIKSKIDPSIDGILGSNFLKHFIVKIDYKKQELYLSNEKINKKSLYNYISIPFSKNIRMGYAPTSICNIDGIDVDCVIDTGDYGVSIPSNIIYKLPEYKKNNFIEPISNSIKSNENDVYDFAVININNLKLHGLYRNNLPVSIPNKSKQNIMTIGRSFLENYKIVIDYPDNVIYLSDYKKDNFSYSIYTFGFGLDLKSKNVNDKYKVNYIWNQSSAFKAGLKVNDTILSVNGTSIENISYLEILDILINTDRINISYKTPGDIIKNLYLDREDLVRRVNQ